MSRDLIRKLSNTVWNLRRCKEYDQADAVEEAMTALSQQAAGVPTFDLDAIAWESIKKAADESTWIPPEYYANDWCSDVCEYLINGHPQQAAGVPEFLDWVAGELVRRDRAAGNFSQHFADSLRGRASILRSVAAAPKPEVAA